MSASDPKVEAFFDYLREREDIRIKKESGQPWPWTEDKVLQEFRFCNVFREDDKVTRWLREHIRDPLDAHTDVAWAVIAFRWFNRIETAEQIKDQLLKPWTWKWKGIEAKLRASGPPWTTGSYIIKTPDGMDKLNGVLWCIDQIPLDIGISIWSVPQPTRTLQGVHDMLRQYPYLGDFMAYEVVTDLRHTNLLRHAPDRMTWANPGPGAVRGLERMTNREPGKLNRHSASVRHWAIGAMRDLLDLAPTYLGELGERFEMREIEHGLCEFDKYERARLGDGRPRQVYRHANIQS